MIVPTKQRPRQLSSQIFRMSLYNLQMAQNPLLRYVFVAILLLIFAWYHPDISGFSHPTAALVVQIQHPSPKSFNNVGDDTDFVKHLLANNSIGPDITFASRRLRYVMDAKTRLQNTEVREPLFPQQFRDISIEGSFHSDLLVLSDHVVDLHVTKSLKPDQIDASNLLFAASTTAERFNGKDTSPLKQWVRWLTDGRGNSNGAGLILAVHGADATSMQETRETLARLGINATVRDSNPQLDMPGRYMDLVRMLWEDPSRRQREYFAIIDDDTFFPAINELNRVLRNFDPKKPYYLGTFTERTDWLIYNQIPMAYGGAGAFLTAPTMRQILAADCLGKKEDGTSKLESSEGDRLLYLCLRAHTNIALTPLDRLWQCDFTGDPSGFYESGHQPLSLHHFKTWHHHSPEKSHLVAGACGEDCVYQKFQFTDNFVVSNGYSVVEYPKGIDFDTLQYEGTFDYGNTDESQRDVLYAQAFGMLRKPLARTGEKRQWMLIGTKDEGGGRVKQIYVKKKDDDRWIEKDVEALPERDSVVVLEWVP